MEPVGSWFSAASYNRLTNQQHGVSAASAQEQNVPQAQMASTSQLFLNGTHHPGNIGTTGSPFAPGPSGFLSPQPVAYDPVFNPLFHQKSHYRAFKQPSEVDGYNYISSSGGNYFEQPNPSSLTWSQNNQLHSPFGVLPHESVIQGASVIKPFENLTHFTPQTINHFNSSNEYKNFDYDNRKFAAPIKTNPAFFCQTVNDYQKFQNVHLQQGFGPVQESGFRFPQAPFRDNQFMQRNEYSCECPPKNTRPLFDEGLKPSSHPTQVQSSPISYAMFDSDRNYPANKPDHYAFHHASNLGYNNRFGASEDCIQRSGRLLKGLNETPEPNIAYPSYYHNSPASASSTSSSPSPVEPSTTVPEPPELYEPSLVKPLENPPLDVSLPRSAACAIVTSKTLSDKTFTDTRMVDGSWDNRDKRPLPPGFDVPKPSCGMECSAPNQIPFKSLKSCRGDPMSLVKTLQQQNHQPPVISRGSNFDCGKRYLRPDFLNRVPPPAHHNTFNQVQTGYFELDRWNSAKIFSATAGIPAQENEQSKKFSIHVQPPSNSCGGFPTFVPALPAVMSPAMEISLPDIGQPEPKNHLPKAVNDPPDFVLEEAVQGRPERSNQILQQDISANPSQEQQQQEQHPQQQHPQQQQQQQQQQPKQQKEPLGLNESFLDDSHVPTLEEELGLPEDADHHVETLPNIGKANPSIGFMNEFLRFVNRSGPDVTRTETTPGLKLGLKSESKNCKFVSSDKKNKEEQPQSGYHCKSANGVEQPEKSTPPTKSSSAFPFPVGDFVVVKNDRVQLHPPVWRVKKNNLLQKFTHFVSRGVAFYSNVPIFVGWSPETKKVYEGVDYKIIKQKKEDWIIKLTPTNLLSPFESASFENNVAENRKYRECFEVYVQTLLSQALDPKFLREITLEKNAYFLSYSTKLESFWASLTDRLKIGLPWDKSIIENLSQSPNYRYETKPDPKMCICGDNMAYSWVALGGITYSHVTLELLQVPHPQQTVALCDSCKKVFELLHQLSHQKYLLYTVCETLVSTNKSSFPDRNNATILSELLKDDEWFENIFQEFLTLWAYADSTIQGSPG